VELHSLRSGEGATKRPKRVGRGRASGLGKTCGRGQKGQMSRSGHKRKPGFEGGQMRFVRRVPKRGFTNINRKVYVPVNVGLLSRFENGTVVDAEALRAAGLASSVRAGIKILGGGELDKKLTVKAQAFSATAKSKIETAGGVCEIT
jgi:large subunit ribosomal protein L15